MSRKRGPGRPRNPIDREVILERATELFAEAGYAGVSMSVLAQRVGLSKASLFHHVSSKDLLYGEVMGRIVVELSGLVVLAAQDGTDFLTRLDGLGRGTTMLLGQRPHHARLLLREMMAEGPFADGPGRQAVAATLKTVAEFLSAGMETGVLPRQDPSQLAMSIVGLHLVWFAIPEASASLVGGVVFEHERVDARADAVVLHVRRLCGVSATVSV